jgi:hypothetical protein
MKRVLITLSAVLALGGSVVACAEDVVWVSDLETMPQLVGKEIVVEGRFQGHVGASLDQIRLKNCNPDRIEFRLEPDAARNFPSSLPYIRLVGTLTRSGDKLVMRVKSWSKTKATDEDRFQDTAQRIDALDHKAWYELGGRMQRLADLYGEKELKALASSARVRGFRAEEGALRSSQSADLLKLADRAIDVGLDAEEARRMRHKALRWKYDALARASSGPARDWFELAAALEQFLPGVETPLTVADAKLVSQYHLKPFEVYDTMPKGRDTCDRAIWVEAITQAMLAQSKEPNADLASLAKEATKRLPDRPELGQQLLRQWAEQEVSRGTLPLPAAQVRRLAEIFRNDLADPKRAQEVLRQWLDARRNKLSARDADGRVRLAKDFRTDLKDDDTAARLLLEAVQIEADLPDAAKELRALGYVSTPAGWKRASDVPAVSNAPRDVANRLPEKNMTAEQVRSIMGDPRPGDKIRLAYRNEGRIRVTEQWTYRGPPDVYVTFAFDSSNEARVIAINTTSQK